MTNDDKFAGLGRMVFGMIEDVLIAGSQRGDSAYGRKTVTTPDGSGGKHEVVIFVVRHKEIADLMEKGVAAAMPVQDMKSGGTTQ